MIHNVPFQNLFTQIAVCDFRLDFDTFDTNAPSNSVETDNAHPCQDILTITTVRLTLPRAYNFLTIITYFRILTLLYQKFVELMQDNTVMISLFNFLLDKS